MGTVDVELSMGLLMLGPMFLDTSSTRVAGLNMVGCVTVGEVTVGVGPPTVGCVPVGAGTPTVGCVPVGVVTVGVGCIPVGEVTVGAGTPTVGWVPVGEVTVGAEPPVGAAVVGTDAGACIGELMGEGATISTATKTVSASVLVSISPRVPSTWLFEGAAGPSSLLTASTLIPSGNTPTDDMLASNSRPLEKKSFKRDSRAFGVSPDTSTRYVPSVVVDTVIPGTMFVRIVPMGSPLASLATVSNTHRRSELSDADWSLLFSTTIIKGLVAPPVTVMDSVASTEGTSATESTETGNRYSSMVSSESSFTVAVIWKSSSESSGALTTSSLKDWRISSSESPAMRMTESTAVSYTHLTLPTKRIV